MKYNDSQIEERVFKKTKELITTRGVKGWSMNNLAKESGVAKNTLYRMINSKEELIRDVILRDLEYIEKQLNQIMMSEDPSTVIEQMSKLISTDVVFYIGGYLNEALMEYPNLEERVQENEENIQNAVIMFIKLGQIQNQIRKDIDPKTVFESIMGMILHFIRLGYTTDQLSNKLELAFNYFFDGIKEKK